LTSWGTEGTGAGQFNLAIGLSVDSSGLVYVADHLNHRIQVFGAEGNYLTLWGVQGTGPGEFNQPHNVTASGSPWVFVLDTYNHRVQKFGFGPISLTPLTWGKLKARYR
jgi:DNA-binding beta-propeller fold protein YncE